MVVTVYYVMKTCIAQAQLINTSASNTFQKKLKKRKISRNYPKKINPPRENLKRENKLKMTHKWSKKQKCQKMKRHMVLGDIKPRIKSNLLETFVSIRYSNYFINKSVKKTFWTWLNAWLFLHSMSCKHALIRHNIFTLLHQAFSKKLKKTQITRNSPKNKEKILTEKFWNMEMCLKRRTRGIKNKMSKKLQGFLGQGNSTPRSKSNLLETFVSNRFPFFLIKMLKQFLHMHANYCVVCNVNMHCSGSTY